MRILLLTTDLELGGTPTVVRELAVRLRHAGIDLEVACLAKWGPVAEQLKSARVLVTPLNASGAIDAAVLFRLLQFVRDRRFDTVFSFLMHANAVAAAASVREPRVRWIQSIQTTQPWPRWHWIVQRLAQRAAEKMVVPSPSVARIARDWAGVGEDRIVVIPNAIDPSDWSQAQSAAATIDPRPYPITFLGRLDPIKDIPTLVRAAAELSPLVHLHIYGEGPDRPRIEQAISRFKSPATLHGAVSSPQAVLSQSGLLVLPSLAEGFGLVLIEAMAAGVPVLGTDVPGIRDVIRHEQNGLLAAAGDPISLAACIGRIVRDKQLRQSLVDRARTDVAERFTWDSVLPKYLDLLR
jgi:glycosyltransferase involved in cell wall biosynthesis